MKRILLLILLFSFSFCKKHEESKVVLSEKTVDFFDPISLGASGVKSNLKIRSHFSECGEWGGHQEDLEIFAKEGNYKDYFLNYTKTDIDCDNQDSKGRNIEKVTVQKTIKLTDLDKKSIISYMKRMIDSKVKERFPGHSGDEFWIINSDSTFVIKVYDRDSINLKSYDQLLSDLKLKQ
ncbi:hypothetical protein [Flavobacterium mesophilum]|uniref:hypothetical protein n=1 Tax=Flavobacterium mesophilum TaxID=3143495 RepID=UPI0031D48750